MIDLPPLIEQCGGVVDRHVVAAIISTESSANPWAINVNVVDGRPAPVFATPQSRDSAAHTAQALVDAGYSVDMGLMQVNSQHLERFGLSADALYDPCTNIKIGTTIYREFYLAAAQVPQFGSPRRRLEATLSAYNTGSFWAGFKNGYVARVMAALRAHYGENLNAYFVSPFSAPLDVAFGEAPTDQEKADMDRHLNPNTRDILARATEAPIEVAFEPAQADSLGAFEETALSLEDAEAARVGTKDGGDE